MERDDHLAMDGEDSKVEVRDELVFENNEAGDIQHQWIDVTPSTSQSPAEVQVTFRSLKFVNFSNCSLNSVTAMLFNSPTATLFSHPMEMHFNHPMGKQRCHHPAPFNNRQTFAKITPRTLKWR